MTYYIKSGNRFDVSAIGNLDIQERLPKGSYMVKFDEQRGAFFLEKTEPFGQLKGKIYGDTNKTADRVMTTYLDRENSTGILLVGEKGSGKTMLAKMLSTVAYDKDIPTLIINTPHCGDVFNKFIQDISQPCVILFDEYEKIYDEEDQEKMLTLLDGVFPQKKLFILTCNNVYKLDTNLKNRPGRIFYYLEYRGLDEEFVREYATDNLDDKSQVDNFVKLAVSLFDTFNFDMMKAMVEEMNRYKETAKEILKYLNTKPSGGDTKYNVSVTVPEGAKLDKLFTDKVTGNPLDISHDVYIKWTDAENNTNQIELECIRSCLVGMDIKTGSYLFEVRGLSIVFTRDTKSSGFDYMNAF